MLDTGSAIDVISEDIVSFLALPTSTKLITLKTVDNYDTQNRRLADFRLESLDGLYKAEINEGLVGQLLTSSSDVPPFRRDITDYPHLHGIDFPRVDGEIELIVGISHCATWVGNWECRRGLSRQPLGLKTAFGWTLIGCCGKQARSNKIACDAITIDNTSLHKSQSNRIAHHALIIDKASLTVTNYASYHVLPTVLSTFPSASTSFSDTYDTPPTMRPEGCKIRH